jgi:hypothetical protein
VWAALARQRALVEEANKRLSDQSAETAELRVAYTAVKEEAVQAWVAEAMAREDVTKPREEAGQSPRGARAAVSTGERARGGRRPCRQAS